MSRLLDRGPIWLLGALAVWHAALAITAASLLPFGNFDHVDFTIDHALKAFVSAWIAFLVHDNQRLRQALRAARLPRSSR